MKPEKKTCKFTGRSYVHYALEEAIMTIKWSPIFNNPNPEDQWNKIQSELERVADLPCPYKNHKVTYSKPAFFTNELLEYINGILS